MTNVDYSDKAITMRLRRLSQLRRLCLSLTRAKRIDPPPGRSSPPEPPSPPARTEPC